MLGRMLHCLFHFTQRYATKSDQLIQNRRLYAFFDVFKMYTGRDRGAGEAGVAGEGRVDEEAGERQINEETRK